MLYVQTGWPSCNKTMNAKEKRFFTKKDELHVEDDCLFWGYRIVIPGTVRPALLQELHGSHMGITRMKSLARSYIWWSNMDKDIELVAKTFRVCCEIRDNPPKTEVQTWPWPSKPWERIHVDYARPLFDKMYLVIVDTHSKWVEIWILWKTVATCTVRCFAEAFARFGLPKQIHTDNGLQFTSEIKKMLLNKTVYVIRYRRHTTQKATV